MSHNITISSWSLWLMFISWIYDVSCAENLLLRFLVFGVILVGVSFWVPDFSGAVNVLLEAFVGLYSSSEGLVVTFDEGKVIGISSCWIVSFSFWKTNLIGFFLTLLYKKRMKLQYDFLVKNFVDQDKKWTGWLSWLQSVYKTGYN